MKKKLIILGIMFLIVGFGIGLVIKAQLNNSTMEQDIEDEEEISSLSTASGDDAPAATIIKAPESTPDPAMPGMDLGGPFTLVNQDGKTVTEKDFTGKYKLIFFGFTYCPDVCPTELQKMTQIMGLLDEETAAKVQPIFISVDPERDDVKTVKAYVEQFDPRLVGLTGTVEQVEAVKKAYRVYAAKVDMGDPDNYMVDHSAFTYFMGPNDENLAIFPAKDTAEDVAAAIKGKI